MRISLIHPSRGRAKKSYANAMEWISSAGCEVELIVIIDNDDKSAVDYYSIYGSVFPNHAVGCTGQVLLSQNNTVVAATNYGAKVSTGDILVYLSDDFKCFENWGHALINEFTKFTGPVLLKVDDCLQDFSVRVLTIPIMNRLCFNVLGYFFHPDFRSMHCDEHLYHRAKKLGFLKFVSDIKFEHQHVSVGKAQDDETYRRSSANWDHGKETLSKHKRMGFTL